MESRFFETISIRSSKTLSRTERLVISTNGYFTDRIIRAAEKFGNKIGFRISIEGLPAANDELRGIKNGFDHGLRTILRLKEMGVKDIGFGSVISHNVTIGNGGARIGNRVYIGCCAAILGNINIGDDVAIGANTVVNFDVPSRDCCWVKG